MWYLVNKKTGRVRGTYKSYFRALFAKSEYGLKSMEWKISKCR